MASKPFFLIGTIGLLLAMVGTIWDMLGYATMFFPSTFDLLFLWIYTIGLLLASFVFFGYKKYYNNSMGFVTFILTLVFIWFYPIAATIDLIGLAGILLDLGFFMFIGRLVLNGVLMILWGVNMILVREDTSVMGITLAAGILFIISGAFYCFVIIEIIGVLVFPISIIGDILFLPSSILAVISLFLSLK